MDYLKILTLVLLIIYTSILYLPMRFSIKNSTVIKRSCLSISSLINSKINIAWEGIKVIYIVIIGLLPVIFIYNKGYVFYYNIFSGNKIWQSIVLLILSIITIIEITFFISIVIVNIVMGKDSRMEMSKVSWIKFDKNNPMYTALVRPIIFAIVEIILYYFIFLGLLVNLANLPLVISIYIIAFLYSISRIIATKNISQGLIYGTFSFILNLLGGALIFYSGCLIYTIILYIIYYMLIAFKE
ncbi:SagF family protein [Clostridium tarantellae]|uniref:Uncharacterized protein n=1 Tax=Clostridium tarantellae TaxID=39493 RepID=A0A6I1MK70_9CLOT|nr:SagF family protein [Clostridium tarantellae]MPQ43785.1 hypothetical protein [Clostridium tarantellae]